MPARRYGAAAWPAQTARWRWCGAACSSIWTWGCPPASLCLACPGASVLLVVFALCLHATNAQQHHLQGEGKQTSTHLSGHALGSAQLPRANCALTITRGLAYRRRARPDLSWRIHLLTGCHCTAPCEDFSFADACSNIQWWVCECRQQRVCRNWPIPAPVRHFTEKQRSSSARSHATSGWRQSVQFFGSKHTRTAALVRQVRLRVSVRGRRAGRLRVHAQAHRVPRRALLGRRRRAEGLLRAHAPCVPALTCLRT